MSFSGSPCGTWTPLSLQISPLTLLNSLAFSTGCSWPWIIHNSPSFAHCPSNLHIFAALQEGSHVQLFTHCTPKESSPQAPILSLCWSTTPAGPMILHQTILKCTFDWYSSPGYPDYSVQAASSSLITLPSMIWTAKCISTDTLLVSRYLMKRFNGIWPHLNP